MKKSNKKQEHKINPQGELILPIGIRVEVSQPGVEMVAKKGTFLYASPPQQAKNHCEVRASNNSGFNGSAYFCQNLKEGESLTFSVTKGILFSLEDDKMVVRFCEKRVASKFKTQLTLDSETLAKFKKLPVGQIDLASNIAWLGPIIHQVLEKGNRLNSSHYQDLGFLTFDSHYLDEKGVKKTYTKEIDIHYIFDKQTRVIARPCTSETGGSAQTQLYEVRVFVKMETEEKTNGRRRPEMSDEVETVSRGYMFASDLQPSGKALKATSKVLFETKPHPGQTRQRSLPNCFLLASIEAILNKKGGPEFIMGMMKQDNEGVVVRLYDKGVDGKFRPVYIRVPNAILYGNDRVPAISQHVAASWHEGGLWLHALENAYVLLGKANDPSMTENFCPSFLSIYGEGGAPHRAMEILTGQSAQAIALTPVFPKCQADGYIASIHRIDGKANPAEIHETLKEVLPSNSLLRFLFHNKVSHLGILLQELKKKLDQNDMDPFMQLNEIFTDFDEKNTATQAEFESELHLLKDKLINVFQDFDEPAGSLLIEELDIQEPRALGKQSFYLLAGKELEGFYTHHQISIFNQVEEHLKNNKLLTASTHVKGTPSGLPGQHAFTIVGCQKIKGRMYVTVRNPWGFVGMKYSTNLRGQTQRVAKYSDVSMVDLEDFCKFFHRVSVGSLPVVPSLGLSNESLPELKLQIKVDKLEEIVSKLEAGFLTYGLISEKKSESTPLSAQQKQFIEQEIDSYFPALQNFMEQKIKALDPFFSFQQFVESKTQRESKIPLFEDAEPFSNEISNLMDTDNNSSAILQYLYRIMQNKNLGLYSYTQKIIGLFSEIQRLQRDFYHLKAASELSDAAQHARLYLQHFKKMVAHIEEIIYLSSRLTPLVSSSSCASFFGPSSQRVDNVKKMSEGLYLLSPYIEFTPGKAMGEFISEFKNSSPEQIEVMAEEISRILSLVNASIRVSVKTDEGFPVIHLKNVNLKDLQALQDLELRFTTDKIVHPAEYMEKPRTENLLNVF